MANPAWPETLPLPLANGANYAPLVENVASTDMETGDPKRRRRFTSVPERFSSTVRLTAAQCETLRTFKADTLADVGLFDWIDFRSGAAATYYFQKTPEYRSTGGNARYWDATLELVKL